MTRPHAIILAAGSSSRLGRNKQLVHLGGEALVRRAVRTALAAGVEHVFVVTGFEHESVAAELADLPCDLVFNALWSEGMGGSLAAGAQALLALATPPAAALVVLPDQVEVTAEQLDALLARAARGPETIVATAYAGTCGPPVVFAAVHFPELAALPRAAGAKTLLLRHAKAVATLPFEPAAVDVDTPADLARISDGSDAPPEVKDDDTRRR
jgi:molybdenum cofactor cytidylyltransferase